MSEMKDRLKELRKTLNLKQREIAERLGVNTGLIGNWESGYSEVPDARIYQLCHEYNVRREWLETGVGEMFEPRKSEEEEIDDMIRKLFKMLPDKLKAAFLRIAKDELGFDEEKARFEDRILETQIKSKPR